MDSSGENNNRYVFENEKGRDDIVLYHKTQQTRSLLHTHTHTYTSIYTPEISTIRVSFKIYTYQEIVK